MRLDRLHADPEPLRDVSGGLSFAQETQHFELARAELPKGPSDRERRLDRGAEAGQVSLEGDVLHAGSLASCDHLRVESVHHDDQGHDWPGGSHGPGDGWGVALTEEVVRDAH